MNSSSPNKSCQNSAQQIQSSSKVGSNEEGSQNQISPSYHEDIDNKETFYLSIRFTQSCSIPILIDSLAPAGQIIEILSNYFSFQNTPLLLFKGKLLENMISLKAQGVQNKDEIVIYDKVINSMLEIGHQSNPFDNKYINNIKKNESVCPDFQTTPFERKIFSILNEINRLEDLTNNMESVEPGNSFYFDTDSESDDSDYDTDDIFFAYSEESDFNLSSYDSNLQNSSLSSILNNTNSNSSSSVKPAKTMKTKVLTVLGPDAKEVSAQPLPTCFQTPIKMQNKNNSIINCLSFRSFEDASRFFANNSSTYWKW